MIVRIVSKSMLIVTLIGLMFICVLVRAGDKDVVSLWKFDKGFGEVAEDSSGNEYDGTIHGAEWVDGISGKALKFTAEEEDYVEIPALAINDLEAGTIEAWVKLDSMDGGAITGKEHGGVVTSAVFSITSYANTNGMFAEGEAGKLYFHSKNPGGPEIAVSSSAIDEQWHHVVVTFDTSNAKFYIDGSLDSTTDGDYSVPDDPDPDATTIGAWLEASKASYFSGTIDEVRIYSQILTEDEVEQDFVQGSAVTSNNKLALTWGEIKASK